MEPSNGSMTSNLIVGNFKLLLSIFLQRKQFINSKQSTKYFIERKLRTMVRI